MSTNEIPASPESSPPPTPPPAPLAPVSSGERVELLDILRGVAVLGILLVNMQLFFAPIYIMAMDSPWTEPLDRAVEGLVLFFAQGKFYTMFSFLFGLGMAMQMERAEARGRPFAGFFARRLIWLLLFGWCHAFLLWFGDILGQYALIGFLLLLFARRKNKTLAVWTVLLLLLPLILFAGVVGLLAVAELIPGSALTLNEAMAQSQQQTAQKLDEALRVYPTGGYGQILPLRARQVGTIYSYVIFAVPNILAMFLIGLNLGRRRLFNDLTPHLPRIRRVLPWLLTLGLILSGVFTALRFNVDQTWPSPLLLLQQIGFMLGSPALSFSYVFGIGLLVQRESWLRRLRPLAAVGRMALTNYLMHSLVFTLLANGYGLGFYGRVRPPVGLVMTLAMFVLQIVLSNWWLGRFRFGPMEWLWRSLSYRKLQPMRR